MRGRGMTIREHSWRGMGRREQNLSEERSLGLSKEQTFLHPGILMVLASGWERR